MRFLRAKKLQIFSNCPKTFAKFGFVGPASEDFEEHISEHLKLRNLIYFVYRLVTFCTSQNQAFFKIAHNGVRKCI